MKAMRIHSFGHADQVFEEDVPKPQPHPGEILVRVHDASINPVDWKVREGHAPMKVSVPMTLGQDFSGEVEAVGSGVNEFKEGDRVFGFARGGAYAEYAIAAINEVAHLPYTIDFATVFEIDELCFGVETLKRRVLVVAVDRAMGDAAVLEILNEVRGEEALSDAAFTVDDEVDLFVHTKAG